MNSDNKLIKALVKHISKHSSGLIKSNSMKTLKSFLVYFSLLLVIGCSAVYTKYPIPDAEGKVIWFLPFFLEGSFINPELSRNEEGLGIPGLEFEQLDDKNLKVYTYNIFNKVDLKDNPEYQLQNNILTINKEKGEKFEEFRVTKRDGQFIYKKELFCSLDLDKNLLILYDKDEREDKKINFLLKKYDNTLILNLMEEEGWNVVLIEPTEEGIIFKVIDPNYTLNDSQINPSDSVLKKLLRSPDFIETFLIVEKVDSTFLGIEKQYLLGAGAGVVLLLGVVIFYRKQKHHHTGGSVKTYF